MENKQTVVNFGFVHLVDAEYEVEPKSKISRLIRRIINRLTNEHTSHIYGSHNFYLPDNISEEEFKLLLSYYLDEFNKEIAAKNLSKEEIIKAKQNFANIEINQKLRDLGFESAGLRCVPKSFYFVESGNFKNEEYKNNFESWYKSNVTDEQVEDILSKLNKMDVIQNNI